MRDVGFCIYCGSTDPPLTREHVLPRGLGGNEAPTGSHEALVLRRASCEPCREITRKIEEECLQGMLGPARKRLGLTRKDRRSPTTPGFVRPRGKPKGSETVQDLIDKHLLGVMVLPAFRMAQYFPDATEKDLGVDYRFIFAERAEIPEEADAVGVSLQFSSAPFARMLAKIALGMAVAKAGPDAFIPFVRGIIAGTDPDVHRYVGGFCEEIPEPEKQPVFHWITMNKHDNLLIVEMQLFAEYGGPRNYVIVGALTECFVTSKHIQSKRAPRIRLR